MKQIFVLLALVFVYFRVSAQTPCTPDTTKHYTHVSNLPDGMANSPYDQTIQFRFPTDTTISTIPFHIDSVKIYKIVGLPYSFSYQCNKKSQTYKNAENGCLTVTGSPVDSQIKSYVIHIYDTAWVTVSGFPTIVTQPGNFPADSVIFKIDSGSNTSSIFYQSLSTKFSVSQNYPNPFNNNTDISFNTPDIQPSYIVVRNELGQLVYTQKLEAIEGLNTYNFERQNLPQGMYFYTIQSGDNIVTRRMVIKD